MKTRTIGFTTLSLLFAVLVLTGCPPKKKLPIEEKPAAEDKDVNASTDTANADMMQPGDVQIQQDWTEIPNLQIINFGYDAATLDDSNRMILKANVAILKKLPTSVIVRVEGHCDDRGTVEYNIALGQRRANAVRSYYATAGIGKARLETISFGEERPICNEENDACWARNRRAQTKVKNAKTIIIKSGQLQ